MKISSNHCDIHNAYVLIFLNLHWNLFSVSSGLRHAAHDKQMGQSWLRQPLRGVSYVHLLLAHQVTPTFDVVGNPIQLFLPVSPAYIQIFCSFPLLLPSWELASFNNFFVSFSPCRHPLSSPFDHLDWPSTTTAQVSFELWRNEESRSLSRLFFKKRKFCFDVRTVLCMARNEARSWRQTQTGQSQEAGTSVFLFFAVAGTENARVPKELQCSSRG